MSEKPETDNHLIDNPNAMFTALWVAVGVLLLFVARRTYGALVAGGFVGTIIVTQLFVTGIAIIAMATLENFDLEKWTYPVAIWVIYTLLVLGIYNFLIIPQGIFTSDVSLFESWSAHLLTLGRNPMAENMLVAEHAWNVQEQSANVTATVDGGVVTSYSYPGGTLWISTLEQWLLPTERLGLAQLLASVGCLSWLVYRVDVGFVPLVLLTWLAPVLRPVSAAIGMITPLWLFPLAVGLASWYDDRLDVAGVSLGIAVASKQLAWPIAGLVVIHVLRTRGRRTTARLVALSGVTCALLVGYLLVWNPKMWAMSAFFPFLPVGDPLVAQGVGLTSLTVGGVVTVPRTLHRVLVIGVAGGLVAATWKWPDSMQWLIPFATIATMVVHYRTLPSYYAATVPLAIIAIDARLRPWPKRDTAVLERTLESLIVRFDPRTEPAGGR